MTESEWLVSEDPAAMLDALRGARRTDPVPPRLVDFKVSSRKLRLFACAVGRVLAESPANFFHLSRPELAALLAAHEAKADGGAADPALLARGNYLCAEDPVVAARHVNSLSDRRRFAPILRDIVGNPFRRVRRERDVVIARGTPLTVNDQGYLVIAGAGDEVAGHGARAMYAGEQRVSLVTLNAPDSTFAALQAPEPPLLLNAWLTPDALSIAQAAYGERDWGRLPVLADALEEAGCDLADLLAHLRSPGPHVRGCWALDLVLGKE